MTTKKSESDDSKQDQTDSEAAADQYSATPSAGRRRLLQGVLASAPVIMTVASRPAWGTATQCWSGIQSGNMSRPAGTTCSSGLSPNDYKKYGSNVWPSSPPFPTNLDDGCEKYKDGEIDKDCKKLFEQNYDPVNPIGGTTFGSVFSYASYPLAGKTLMQVLWQDSGSFASHAIAVYFNSFTPGYTFPPQEALDIINEILTSGYYTDKQNTTWSETDMINLFVSTYTYP